MQSPDEDEADEPDLFAEVDKAVEETRQLSARLFGEHHEFARALIADSREARLAVETTDSQFGRRTWLRAFFAFVEGAVYARRRVVLEMHNHLHRGDYSRPSLTHAELMLLEGSDYELEDNGHVRKRSRGFQPTLKYIRFVFDTYFKFYGRPNPIDFGGGGWRRFREAYEVRNRITHPKRLEDLEISDAELAALGSANRWFFDHVFKQF
jgi:hypothetical protein